jgi:transcriptional regulator with XRE-family HTH domain
VSKTSEREEIIAQLMELIQDERLRQKLSLNEVAARSGLSHTMVMRVEKREDFLPSVATPCNCPNYSLQKIRQLGRALTDV